MRQIVIGSRGSKLALEQARSVEAAIREHVPDVGIRIEVIRTSGDKLSRAAIAKARASVKGLFVKEIEEALLEHRIDIAVHSLKDLPGELPNELSLGAVPKREDPRDVLITAGACHSLGDLRENARIGTSSLRRRVQLQHLRPDLSIRPVRGNVDTRIRKMRRDSLDGIVLAAAGLRRLGLQEHVDYTFTVDQIVPAIGQGALGIEVRSRDSSIHRLIEHIDHPESRVCIEAERVFLEKMGGGCHVPMGGHAYLRNGRAFFLAFVGSPTRPEILKRATEGDPADLQRLALDLAEDLLSQGAREMILEAEHDETGDVHARSHSQPPSKPQSKKTPGHQMPLRDRRILITRSEKQASRFRELLEKAGAKVLEIPTIRIEPRMSRELDRAIREIGRYDWLMFTSVNGVKIFMQRAQELGLLQNGKDAVLPRVCTIGPATAREVIRHGFRVDLIPKIYQAEGILDEFLQINRESISGLRILIPRASRAREILPDSLREHGATVDVIGVYDTTLPEENRSILAKLLREDPPDLITFTSSSTVRNFISLAPDENLSRFRYAAIGPITADTAEEHGLKISVQARKSSIPDLVKAIEQHFADQKGA